jgi:hypothetical protein
MAGAGGLRRVQASEGLGAKGDEGVMIKSVALGEELVITAKNRVGLMADVAAILAMSGVNIVAALGYETGDSAKLMLVTSANLMILDELKKQKNMSVEETEVVMVELEDKPGALKVVTTELKNSGIDIKYLYITSPFSKGGSSSVIMQTSDNEEAMALLSNYTGPGGFPQ